MSLGLVRQSWRGGKLARVGEFPQGIILSDLDAWGPYLSGRLILGTGRWRGYLLASAGLMRMSSVRAIVDGAEIPYWRDSWGSWGDVGADPERDNPDPLIGEATYGGAVPLTIGFRFALDRRPE
ncbi:MAG: hypothetical protein JSV80_06235 [Acidobacteriota bacterium]|nr:MAG: hypothetical protein JSV80_06235 [Acidobacteriota bacterium]